MSSRTLQQHEETPDENAGAADAANGGGLCGLWWPLIPADPTDDPVGSGRATGRTDGAAAAAAAAARTRAQRWRRAVADSIGRLVPYPFLIAVFAPWAVVGRSLLGSAMAGGARVGKGLMRLRTVIVTTGRRLGDLMVGTQVVASGADGADGADAGQEPGTTKGANA